MRAIMDIPGRMEREHTPIELARWLVELARRCRAGLPLEAA